MKKHNNEEKIEKEIEEDFMTLKEEDICIRCKKNKATLIYTNSQMDFIHGFTEKICQECYDEQMKESNWYKEGYQQGLQRALEITDKWWKSIDIIHDAIKDNNKVITPEEFEELKSLIIGSEEKK